uniref:Uncharacterized protein n=1 Tax=Romanomermis culicivorax TaxID=13658 RepID=A0A915KX17_ROMCU
MMVNTKENLLNADQVSYTDYTKSKRFSIHKHIQNDITKRKKEEMKDARKTRNYSVYDRV